MGFANYRERYAFGCFSIGDLDFPRLLFGTSPFFGAGQFGDRSMRYYHNFYLNPQNITWLYRQSISRGLNAIHVPSDPTIVEAIVEATDATGVGSFVLATVEAHNLDQELGLCRTIGADSIITHGSFTDSSPESLREVLNRIKMQFRGITTGIATHTPGLVLPKVLELKEAEIILAPINLTGDFMEPSVESTLEAIAESRRRGKKVIAMKSLAAGSLTPDEAFKYVADKVDGVAVGITSPKELDEVLAAASKYFR